MKKLLKILSKGIDFGLIVNGGFDTDTDWTKGAGVTISGGTANFSGFNSSLDPSTPLTLVDGTTYELTYTITDYTSGDITPRFTGSPFVLGTTRNAAGTYTETLTANANSANLSFRTVALIGSIDNVILKAI